MRLVGREKLLAFQAKHPDVKPWVAAWAAEVEAARWKRPIDVIKSYGTAKIINKTTIVFKVKGNAYRLEVHISFDAGVVNVARWGTHAEYDRWEY